MRLRRFLRLGKRENYRVTEADKDKDGPLSDGLMNFYWAFPISRARGHLFIQH